MNTENAIDWTAVLDALVALCLLLVAAVVVAAVARTVARLGRGDDCSDLPDDDLPYVNAHAHVHGPVNGHRGDSVGGAIVLLLWGALLGTALAAAAATGVGAIARGEFAGGHAPGGSR